MELAIQEKKTEYDEYKLALYDKHLNDRVIPLLEYKEILTLDNYEVNRTISGYYQEYIDTNKELYY